MTKEKLKKTYYRLRIREKSYIVWGIGIIVDFGESLMFCETWDMLITYNDINIDAWHVIEQFLPLRKMWYEVCITLSILCHY